MCITILFYIYFGYPLILSLRKAEASQSNYVGNPQLPRVSILIPAHNEEKHIAQKIQNHLDLDYPKDLLQILIASDGSTDNTVKITKSFNDRRVKVFAFDKRRGKNAVLNEIEHHSNGEILVFTDANALFVKDAIQKLVAGFRDENVGLVCGHLKYLKGSGSNVGRGEGLYFKYESLIKRLESRWGTLPVVTGSIYAIRKKLFVSLDPAVANDFAHPVQVGAKGYKVIFEPEAIAYEQATTSISEEFRRRSRIVTRGFTAFGRYWRKYRMLSGMRGLCYISHKLLRWFAPFFLISIFITNLYLDSIFFKITLFVQIGFYSTALIGLLVKGKFGKMFTIPFYFCLINLAALAGFINYIRGRRQSIWEVAATTR